MVAHVDSNLGFERGTVDGVDIWRDAHSIVTVHDDIVIDLSSQDPGVFDEYDDFIDAFFAHQPFQPA